MSQTDYQFQMPDPLDMPVLIEKYQNNDTDEVTALLKSSPMGTEPWGRTLTSGSDLMSILAMSKNDVRPADHDLDGGWGGLDETLGGLERMYTRRGPTPVLEEEELVRQRAELLRNKWIGGNLKFLLLPYADEWRESDLRLKRVDLPMGEGLETPREALEKIGQGLALGRLQRLHSTYGLVLKLGVAQLEIEARLRAFKEALDHFLSGVRFHFKGHALAQTLFWLPYEESLEAGSTRRKKIQAQRKARKKRNNK